MDNLDQKQKDQIEIISAGVTSAVMTTIPFIKAVRAARRGEYARATFYAILWVGFKQSADASHRERVRRMGIRYDIAVNHGVN